MKSLKSLGYAGGLVAAALLGGTLISAVAAAPGEAGASGTTASTESDAASEYCTLWRETFASELGVSVDDLNPAAKAASIAVVDQLLADDKITEGVAERMKNAIEAFEGDGCRLLGGWMHRLGGHAFRVEARHDLLNAAAGALGIEPSALIEALRSGDSLTEIAESEGVSYADVSAAIVAAATEDLSAAVESGRITQDRADEMIAHLSDALESGDWPPAFDGPMGDRHPGFRFFGGPGDQTPS
jgi:hypothetical protein